MSETTAPMEPTARLRAHAGSILASSSVPAAEREDLAEELYGHLWQRWQDALAAGASASEAVETAIRSFGQASRLGREMTGAYHSRLYSTTIGVLLPAVAAPPGQPAGLLNMWLLIGVVAVFQLALVGTLVNLTPVRAVVFALSAGLSVALSVLAFRALGRAQRWALRYSQFVLALLLVESAATIIGVLDQPLELFTGPILALFALWVLDPAIGGEMAEWFSHSRPLGRGPAIVLVVAVAAGFGLPPLATVMPDPTQVSASDLDLQVSAACTRDADGGVTDIEVTTSLQWSRLDLLPYGLGQPETPERFLDRVASGVLPYGGASASEWRTAWIAVPSYVSSYQFEGVHADSPDGSGAQATAVRSIYVRWAGTGMGVQFLHGEPHAGQTYTIVHRLHWPRPAVDDEPPPVDPLVAVWYLHLDRFVVQAVANCDQSGTGVLVGSPTGVSE